MPGRFVFWHDASGVMVWWCDGDRVMWLLGLLTQRNLNPIPPPRISDLDDSAFLGPAPRLGDKTEHTETKSDGWDLRQIPFQFQGLLRFLKDPIPGVNSPMLCAYSGLLLLLLLFLSWKVVLVCHSLQSWYEPGAFGQTLAFCFQLSPGTLKTTHCTVLVITMRDFPKHGWIFQFPMLCVCTAPSLLFNHQSRLFGYHRYGVPGQHAEEVEKLAYAIFPTKQQEPNFKYAKMMMFSPAILKVIAILPMAFQWRCWAGLQ